VTRILKEESWACESVGSTERLDGALRQWIASAFFDAPTHKLLKIFFHAPNT
jgi:hypothetical protein